MSHKTTVSLRPISTNPYPSTSPRAAVTIPLINPLYPSLPLGMQMTGPKYHKMFLNWPFRHADVFCLVTANGISPQKKKAFPEFDLNKTLSKRSEDNNRWIGTDICSFRPSRPANLALVPAPFTDT